jgi:hypothetical protein
MALIKQSFNLNFSQGVDTKSDPNQIPLGKFQSLKNMQFSTTGAMSKSPGYTALPALPAAGSTALTTFKDNLLALGSSIYAYSAAGHTWVSSGAIQAVQLSVQPVLRTATSQTSPDVAVAPSGLACATCEDSSGAAYYQIFDSNTGQAIVPATALPATATSPRVFILGRYFVVTFLVLISATPFLRYIAIPQLAPTNPSAVTDISSQVSGLTAGYDAIVANDSLYVAHDGSDVGGAIRITYIDSTLLQHNTVVVATHKATYLSMAADTSGSSPVLYVSWWSAADSSRIWTAAYTPALSAVLATTQLTAAGTPTLAALTSVATSGVLTVFYQVNQTYSYNSVRSDLLRSLTCTQAGVVGSPAIVARGVGLASKAFLYSGTPYMMVAYSGALQPSYFLINSSGLLFAKLAYQNGGGYASDQILPQANVSGSTIQIAYLFKDMITSVNKTQGSAVSAGFYSQTGINLASFAFGSDIATAEIGKNLHLTGGYLSMYDGVKPVEHGFHLYPEDLGVSSTPTTGGFMTAQQYYYIAVYEWTDNQANIHRSAPSIALSVNLTSAGTSTSRVILNIPTLRLTAKAGTNPIRIVLYRWSTAQQNYYQVTGVSSPLLNDPTVDSVSYTDTLADTSIIGNALLYTTGGVVEDIGAPATAAMALFKSRLVLLDAEDRNLLWYSKQVLDGTPVELSDLLTIYVAPTTGAQGSTGPVVAPYAMDDKLIIFKKSALYYVSGTGPDNTGANNDFSDPIFITSTVGLSDPKSLVLTPVGIMFKSDKGIWLLGRDLSTTYVGIDVEGYNDDTVTSAVAVPGTNEVRFTLASGIVLVYDYFYRQWQTRDNTRAVASAIYQGLHTYLNEQGLILQQTPDAYLNGTAPVLMSFTTGWISMAELQGYERLYFLYLLGKFLSPHKIEIGIAYDYNPSIAQTVTIRPTNFTPAYGGDTVYGANSVYGGSSPVEQWRIFPQIQKCQAFQITLQEVYDPSLGVAAGAGFLLSTLKMVVGMKKGYSPLPSSQSVG